MYLTQSHFTGPRDPSPNHGLLDPIDENKELSKYNDPSASIQPFVYPNKWMEERNLRTFHQRANSTSVPNIENKKYLEVWCLIAYCLMI